MNPKTPYHLNLFAGATLVSGLIVAAYLYLTAAAPATYSMIDEYKNSKTYARSLKLYGGQMAVLADDFNRCFAGLWQGQNLAVIIGVFSIIVAGCLTLEARYLRKHAGNYERK